MAAVAVALSRTAAPARRPSVTASASCLLLGQRPSLASPASCFAARPAAVAHPAAGFRLRTRRQRLSVGAIADNYPIFEVTIKPKDEADADKMANGLTKLAWEIPSLQFSRNELIIVKGTGELDLDNIVDRLKREFEVEVNVGYPQVVYREIISKTVEAQYVYNLPGTTHGRFADVTLRIEPMERGSGYEFKSEIKGGAMPEEYIEEVMRGIEYTLPNGILAECPIVDLRVVLVAGSYNCGQHRPFNIAAMIALLQGLQEAGPRLLEPVMGVEVITPGEHLDSIIDNLTFASGELKSIEEKPGGLKVVEALVPLASMFEYANTLNRLSKGHASYTMQLAKFVDVPEHMQKQISRERREWERPQSHLSVAIADNYPIVKVGIEPKDKADADKMANGLTKLAQEIASIHISRGYETSTFIEGTGELDLDTIVDRLKREFEVEVNVGSPQVVYREIISKAVEAQEVYKLSGKIPIFAGVTERIRPMNYWSKTVESQYVFKQSGTGPRFADVTLRIEPLERGSGYEFKSEIKGGAMTKDYVEEVMRGIEDTLPSGILAECPVVDLRVVLIAGSFRSVLAGSFRIAARFALLKGLREADPRLVEPVMRVEVRTPEYLDDITVHLLSAGGQVESIEEKPGELKVVEALVPLSNMFEFSSTLNLLSKGRASYTMQLAKFVTVPQHIQDRISREIFAS